MPEELTTPNTPQDTGVTETPATPPATPPVEAAPPTVEVPSPGPAQQETPVAPAPPPESAAEPTEASSERVVPAADGFKLPEGAPPQLGEFAHATGLTQEQLDANIGFFGQVMGAQQTQQVAEIRKAGEAHLESWGDKADYNLSLAKRALKQNDPTGKLSEMLELTGYGSHPAVLDFLHGIGNSMKEGGFLKGTVNTPPGKQTLAQSMYGANHPSKN